MAQKLEKSLAHRPEKSQLIERNILKGEYRDSIHAGNPRTLRQPMRTDDTVAPALQAAKEKLQRSQLEVRFHACG